MGDISETLSLIAIQATLILIWLAGIVLALLKWRQHPKVSLLTSLVLAGFLLDFAASHFVYWLIPKLWEINSPSDLRTVSLLIGLARASVEAALWVFLLIAVFGWRQIPGGIIGPDGQYLPADFFTGERPPNR